MNHSWIQSITESTLVKWKADDQINPEYTKKTLSDYIIFIFGKWVPGKTPKLIGWKHWYF